MGHKTPLVIETVNQRDFLFYRERERERERENEREHERESMREN